MKIIQWMTPVLLLIGTVGLLLNEFAFSWGRPATIVFAISNVVGITLLIMYNRQNRSRKDNKSA